MDTVENKYVWVEINRPTIEYFVQVDKSVNLEELEEDELFYFFLKDKFWGDIFVGTSINREERFDIEIRETTLNPHNFMEKHTNYGEWFLYKSGDDFSLGEIVPPNTKSIIRYNPLKTGGKIINKHIEVFLSSTKEETKELWNKGDIKTLSNYFITNTWVFYDFSPKHYEPDDKGTLQLIYDEKDNPVETHLLDVETYQKDDRGRDKGDLLE